MNDPPTALVGFRIFHTVLAVSDTRDLSHSFNLNGDARTSVLDSPMTIVNQLTRVSTP
jgi:hypothetical protein